MRNQSAEGRQKAESPWVAGRRVRHLRASGNQPLYPFRPGYAVPIPLPLFPYSPHPLHSRAHPGFAAERLIRDAIAVPIWIGPRQPTTGSDLSSMLFHNISSSETTGNSSAALTQYFTENFGLQLGIKVSAFPSSSHSDPGEVCVFEA